jgi:ubiquinone biosynthesis protein UbiJ
VSEFLSDPWFEELNARLMTATPEALPEGTRPCQVVIDVPDAPDELPHALTLSISDAGVRVAPGDSPNADAVLRLSYLDAAALTAGQLDSANALREGRIKVRGDVNVLVPLTSWLHVALEN